jgi:tetratricopeptide (TPR) repeat protein
MDSETALSLLALAEDAEVGLSGPESSRWRENLEKRLGDLQGAAAWFLEHGEPARALRLAAALTAFWRDTGRLEEGRRWMQSVLAGPAAEVPSAARATALCGLATLAFKQGDQETARIQNEEALHIARAADDWPAQILALVGLARVALRDGDAVAGREHAERARTLARDMRNREAESSPLHLLAAAARVAGELRRAQELYDESVALARELKDDAIVAVELLNLGHVERQLGNHDRSEHLFRESLRLSLAHGSARLIPDCLVGLGCTAAVRGDLHRAARLLAAGQAALEAAGAVLDPDDQPEFDRAVNAVRERLDPGAFDALWEEGRTMDADRAVGFALEGSA